MLSERLSLLRKFGVSVMEACLLYDTVNRNRPDANAKPDAHKAAKLDLRITINRSKAKCCKKHCDDVNDDPLWWATHL